MGIVKRVSYLSVVALGFSALCHLVAMVFVGRFGLDLQLYTGIGRDLPVFVVISFALSLGMFLVAELSVFRVLLALKALLLLAVAYPFGVRIAATETLFFSLIFEIFVYDEFPVSLAFNGGLIFVSVAYRIPSFIGSRTGDYLPSLSTYLLASAGIAFCGGFLTHYRQQMIESRTEAMALDRTANELSSASEQYLQIAHSTEERSTRDERLRITRELHDTIGYSLTNLIMIMEAAKALTGVDPRRLQESLNDACSQAQQALEETRRSLHQLRENQIEGPRGVAAIQRLAATFSRATSVQVEIDYTNVPFSCGDQIDAFMYHFVREGLTNAFRHGKATSITIRIWREDDSVTLSMRDNGLGADSIEEGIGMRGMREELGSIGGTLEAGNTVDGFLIRAEIPLSD